MWTVTERNSEYAVADHNGTEQARLAMDSGVSTSDVREVMHDRAADLKDDAKTAATSNNPEAAIASMVEWATIIEDMAGGQIQLPQPDQ